MIQYLVFDVAIPSGVTLSASIDGPVTYTYGPIPVAAVAGHFPNLPRTPAPLGIEVEQPGHRRCKSCGVEQPWREFRYANGGNVAATCLDCRTGR